MIEPVIATALILSILALIAYYLQPRKPHHQRHYYHQIRRARVMADPQRRGREGGLFVGAERRNERQVYERGNEDGGREAGEWASGVRKLNTAGRGVVESRLVQEEGVDAEDEKEAGAAAESVVEDASSDKLKVHTDAISQASIVPVIGSPFLIAITFPPFYPRTTQSKELPQRAPIVTRLINSVDNAFDLTKRSGCIVMVGVSMWGRWWIRQRGRIEW